MATGTDDDVEGHSPPFSDAFLENAGQVRRSDVRYYATAGGVTFGFARAAVLMSSATPDGAGGLIRVRFAGANPVEPEGRRESSFRTNFFLGSDSAGWRTGLRSYQEIAYPNLYDGIDLIYRLNERGAKYEFTVRPWADMSILRLSYEGVNSLRVSASGDLVLSTPLGERCLDGRQVMLDIHGGALIFGGGEMLAMNAKALIGISADSGDLLFRHERVVRAV